MILAHGQAQPRVHETAYVAPNAVLCGDVTIAAGACILFGAVLNGAGGAIVIGSDNVIMEGAVIRGTPKHPVHTGDAVLVGPRAHLTGCQIEGGVFLATGATIFNGAHIGADAEVRINGVVHVNTVLAPGATVPIGWVAIGDPAQILPPDRHEEIWQIQRELDFPGTVFASTRDIPTSERTRRYARALRHHSNDRLIDPL